VTVKFQGAVGGGVDVSLGGATGNVRGANVQWLVAKGVRDFDADLFSPDAGMDDEAKSLIVEGLHAPFDGSLRGRGPGSNPMILGGISERKTKQKGKSEGAVP
jgi:hypothetical protein